MFKKILVKKIFLVSLLIFSGCISNNKNEIESVIKNKTTFESWEQGTPLVGFIVDNLNINNVDINVKNCYKFLTKDITCILVKPVKGKLKDQNGNFYEYNKFTSIFYIATGKKHAEILFKDKINQDAVLAYVKNGGGLLVSVSALYLLNVLGIEKAIPRYIDSRYNQSNIPISFSVSIQRQHPIYTNFNFDFQPYITTNDRGHCAIVDFHKRKLTNPNAKVLNQTIAKEKSIVDFSVGRGHIISIGWSIPDFTSKTINPKVEKNKRRLFNNAIKYLSEIKIDPENSLKISENKGKMIITTENASVEIDTNALLHPVNERIIGTHITYDWLIKKRAIWVREKKSLNYALAKALKPINLRFLRWNIWTNSTWDIPKGVRHVIRKPEEFPIVLERARDFSKLLNIPFSDCVTFLGCPSLNKPDFPPEQWAKSVKDINITGNLNMRYWEILNEPWAHNFGYPKYANYAKKCAALMKKVDPSIKIGVSGNYGLDEDLYVIKKTLPDSDWLILHYYFGRNGMSSLKDYYYSSFSGVENFRLMTRKLDNSIKAMGLKKSFPIGITEWASEASMATYGCNYMQALNDSAFLIMLLEENIVDFAAFHIFSRRLVGAYDFKMQAPGYAFQLIGNNIGKDVVSSIVKSGSFISYPDISGVWANKYGINEDKFTIPYISVFSSLNKTKDKLFVIVLNKAIDRNIETSFSLKGKIKQQNIILKSLNAYSNNSNGVLTRNDKNQKGYRNYQKNIYIKNKNILIKGSKFKIFLEKHSVNAFSIDLL